MASSSIDGSGTAGSVGNGGTGNSAGDKQWTLYGPYDDFASFANDGSQMEFVEGGGSYGDGLIFPDDGTLVYVHVIVQVSLFATCTAANANYTVGEVIQIPLLKANNNAQVGTGADSFYYYIDPTGNGTVHVRYAGGGGASDNHDQAVMNGGINTHGSSGKRVAFNPEKWDYSIFIEGLYTS